MVYSVITSHRAKQDMKEIGRYIAEELQSPQSARNLLESFEREINELNQMPKRFAYVSDENLARKGIRWLPVKNYSIFYNVDEDTKTVTVIRVYYARRDWANLL